MNLSRSLKYASYSLVGSGFGALASTGALHPAAVALLAGIFALSWWVHPRTCRRQAPARIAAVIVPLGIGCAAIGYAWLSRSRPEALLHLLPLAAAASLLFRRREGDYGVAALLGGAQLLAAAALTGDLVFLLWFLPFLVSALAFLILAEMRRGRLRSQRRNPGEPAFAPGGAVSETALPAGAFSTALLGIAFLVLGTAVPLFFLLPRATPGFYREPALPARFVTGFSDRVELGRDGTLEPSDTVVMRVKTNPADGVREPRWRGLAFDRFDGRSWTRSDAELQPVPVQGRFYKLETTALGTRWIEQTYFLESPDTPVAFTLSRALAVGREAGALGRDATGNLVTRRLRGAGLSYTVISDSLPLDPAAMSDRFPIPEEIVRKYLQLPNLDPRIARRAREVTRTATDRYARGRALEEHLRSQYTYSLELEGMAGSDPLAAFLFTARAGHCEYFASALAVMMRLEGIPSRLVNGYRAGDYNRIGDHWTVRQRHAHSWVEAWFPPYGWIEFDPTPAPPPTPRPSLADLRDAVGLWWREGVVHYDSPRQRRIAGRAAEYLRDLWNGEGTTGRSARDRWGAAVQNLRAAASHPPWHWTLWLALPALLAARPVRTALRAAAVRLRRRNLHPATAAYLEVQDMMNAHGFERRPGQTPLEFARSLGTHPAAAPLLELTGRYNAARFGNPEAPAAEPGVLLRSLHDALKKNRRSPD